MNKISQINNAKKETKTVHPNTMVFLTIYCSNCLFNIENDLMVETYVVMFY